MRKVLVVIGCLALFAAMVAFDVVFMSVFTVLGLVFLARPRAVSDRLRRGATWSANWGWMTWLTAPLVVVLIGAGWLWVVWWPFGDSIDDDGATAAFCAEAEDFRRDSLADLSDPSAGDFNEEVAALYQRLSELAPARLDDAFEVVISADLSAPDAAEDESLVEAVSEIGTHMYSECDL